MATKYAAAIVAVLSVNAAPAYAATLTGWITYISEDGHQLMLDSNYMFTVGPKVDLSSVAIGNRVKLNSESHGGEKIITSITRVPFNPTSS